MSNGNLGDESFVEVEEVEKRLIVIIGRRGVGKSTIYGCLLGKKHTQRFGFNDGSLETSVKSFRDGSCTISVFDTRGWTGIEKEDLQIFQEMRNFIQDEGAKIQKVFFVITAKRFTKVDQDILNFLQYHASEAMKSIIHVVVTHAPEFEQDEQLKKDLKQKFAFLLPLKTEEEFTSKFTFVDLLDPRRFEKYPDLYQIILDEWSDFRRQMIALIKESDRFVPVRAFKKTSDTIDFVRLRRQFLFVSFLILAISILAALLDHYMKFTWQLKTENQLLEDQLSQAQSTVQNISQRFATAIAVANTVGTVAHSVGTVATSLGSFISAFFH